MHARIYVTNVRRSRFFKIKAEVYLLDRMWSTIRTVQSDIYRCDWPTHRLKVAIYSAINSHHLT